MYQFRKYEKVERIEKPECEGILNGTCYIFEKIDGANAAIWRDEEGKLCTASRNRQLSCGLEVWDSFRGFAEYVYTKMMNIGVLLDHYPNLYLHGEWLVKHTINYPKEAYQKFYVFDVYDMSEERYLTYAEYAPILELYNIEYLKPLGVLKDPTFEDLQKYVGRTQFGIPFGEGIVVKNYDFINQFGHCVYGKIVRKEFKEVNALIFNPTKEASLEVRIASQYITPARVYKMAEKIYDEIGRPAQIEDLPQVLGRVFNDLVAEDMWEIIKKNHWPTINYALLKKNVDMVTKNYFVDYLQQHEIYGKTATEVIMDEIQP